jgi:hypothetical protein
MASHLTEPRLSLLKPEISATRDMQRAVQSSNPTERPHCNNLIPDFRFPTGQILQIPRMPFDLFQLSPVDATQLAGKSRFLVETCSNPIAGLRGAGHAEKAEPNHPLLWLLRASGRFRKGCGGLAVGGLSGVSSGRFPSPVKFS